MKKESYSVYGEICWLWSLSPLHITFPVDLQAKTVLPAIQHGQYHIVYDNDDPVAYCCWAFLDIEREFRFLSKAHSLRPQDWNCGDRLWFIDWISPFERKFTFQLKREMDNRFSDRVARSLRVRRHHKQANIREYTGSKLPYTDSQEYRNDLFNDIKSKMFTPPR